ncbi:MAG: preprotein translocase subunit SecG [Oligoflexia bacterium]|nr:preprotein translocase subunit SecG [Oligoflexia bacterium]
MSIFLTVLHVLCCVMLVTVVLLQAGKGAEISASFGGSSQTVFGSSGGANFFVKFTSIVAGIFMATSLTLTVLGSQSRKSLFEETSTPISAPATSKSAAPAAPMAAQPSTAPAAQAPAPVKTGAASH